MTSKDARDKFENQLLQAQLEIQAEKFKTASREIYDNISQVLAYVRIGILKAAQQYQDANLATDSKLLVQAIQDLRSLNSHLDPDEILKKGIIISLEEEMERIRKNLSVSTTLTVSGKPFPLSKDALLIIYRALQECIHNALSHGNPQNLILHISYTDKDVIFSLQDDGTGFEVPHPLPAGRGLQVITERAQLANAEIRIESAPGRGTKVTIKLWKDDDNTSYS